jgi:hypothetical protein
LQFVRIGAGAMIGGLTGVARADGRAEHRRSAPAWADQGAAA